MSELVHVAVFAYNRPKHLMNVLSDLSAMEEAGRAHVRIYIDGPKDKAGEAASLEVLNVAKLEWSFARLEVVSRSENLGLAKSIIGGVSEMTDEFGEVVVIEDDLRLSPHFLRYMNDGLATYRDTPSVYSIHGYCYPVREDLPETFFLRGADCWGWATWSRAWKEFDPDAQGLLERVEGGGLSRQFDLDRAYPYTKMLHDNARGRNDSWAIRWHATAFLDGAMTLYPGNTLVLNAGLDGSGTHSGDLELHSDRLSREPIHVLWQAPQESATARTAFANYLRRTERRRRFKRIGALIKRPRGLLDIYRRHAAR